VASEPLGLRLPRLVECLQNEGVLWNDDLTALVVEGPR
jgi:hypothetical protein